MTIETLYKSYLAKVGLDESQMGEVQRKETKRAFMGGCALILEHISTDVSKMTEDEAFDEIIDLIKQTNTFFFNELKNFN